MKRLLMAACALLAVGSAHAQNYSTQVHLMIKGDSSQEGSRRVVGKGEAIVETIAVSPRAARITEDVTVGVVGTGFNLPKDTPMFGRYEDSVWTYCGSFPMNSESTAASVVALGVLTAGFSLMLEPFMDRKNTICLHDVENDGVFDSGWGDSSPNMGSSRIVYALNEKSMSTAAKYERIDPWEGPSLPVSIAWTKKSNSGTLVFSIKMDGQEFGSELAAIPVAGGKPVEVKISGVELLLHGYNAENKTVDVEVVKGFIPRYTRIPAVLTVTTYYY